MMHSHRSGKLKQKNKAHKSSGLSKRQLKRSNRGRVENNNPRRKSVKAQSKTSQAKQRRQNAAAQRRRVHREQLRLERTVNTSYNAPKNVMFFTLDDKVDVAKLLESMCEVAGNKRVNSTTAGHVMLTSSKLKNSRFMFLNTARNLMSMLDAAKVADLVVVVFRATAGTEDYIDELGDQFLTCLRAQGLPSVIGVIHGLRDIKNKKTQNEMKKLSQRFFRTEFGKDIAIMESESPFQILRSIDRTSSSVLHWRQIRSYVLANDFKVIPCSDDNSFCDVQLQGYVRGLPMDPKAPVHLTGVAGGDGGGGDGFGTYLLRVADLVSDPMAKRRHIKKSDEDTRRIYVSDCKSLEEVLERTRAEAEVDVMANGEQTWPTEAEMGIEKSVEENSSNKMEEDGEDDDDNDDDIEEMWNQATGGKIDNNNTEKKDVMDEEDLEREALIAAEREDMEFPDEMITPRDFPAHKRFARYRGLKSFRTSPWDPMESLPEDYSKIYRFQGGFAHLQLAMERLAKGQQAAMKEHVAGVEKDQEEFRGQELLEGRILPGSFVRFVVGRIPIRNAQVLVQRKAPLIMSSLLPHEHRLSVLHFRAQKAKTCEEPLKSKRPLTFQCGFRRFKTRPLYSVTSGSKATDGTSEKAKFNRFMPQNDFCGATTFGPVTYAPAPLLMFDKKTSELVGTGSLMSNGRGVDPDRVILKRIILTGYPSRVHKNNATIVQMFFNAEDIQWFKPIELRTKYGLTGSIRDSIGTHGHMKCMFNKSIKQHDTVCLNLYKRCYPKWVGDDDDA